MHEYSTDRSRAASLGLLVAMSTLGAWGLSLLIGRFVAVPWYVDVPSIAGVFGALLLWVQAGGWKMLPWRLLIQIPRLEGKWAGTVQSSHDNFMIYHPLTLEIRQNWWRLCVHVESDSSRSDSVTACVSTDGPTRLIYYFRNVPKSGALDTMQSHSGVAELTITRDGIEGDYFSGRGRETHGRMTLKRVGAN